MKNTYNHPLYYWHIELSSKCVLACPRCPRTGEANKKKYKATTYSFEFFREVFNPELIRNHIKKMLFCGGHGDPIYCRDLFSIISYIKSCNPDVNLRIVTNGSYRSLSWWQELSALLTNKDVIVFSIDGWDQASNEKYRVNSDFKSIMNGLDVMTKSPVNVLWSTIAFRFNVDEIDKIENLSKKMGCDGFILTLSTKFGPQWVGGGELDPLEPPPEKISQLGTYKKFIHFSDNTPDWYKKEVSLVQDHLSRIKDKYKGNFIFPRCRYGEKGLYVDASGIFYPCSWMSHPFDMPLKEGQKNLWLSHREKFDLTKRNLEDVLNDKIWEDLFETWESPSSCYAECENKCLKKDVLGSPIYN